MIPVRPAAVAGAFYPGTAGQLTSTVDALLGDAQPARVRPKALVVPHAGYVYSGPVAASAYATLEGLQFDRVVLVGPAHFVAVNGMALPDCAAFETPLGRVPIDEELAARALELPYVKRSELAHEREHSLEVQLPFLQRVLGRFSLLPVAVGRATGAEVAELLEKVWGGPETLVLISTDLSHYLPYAAAQQVDAGTAALINALDFDELEHDQACGAVGLKGLLRVAKQKGLQPVQLDLRNSGDTAGDRRRVVGYGAWAFEER